MQLKKYFFFLPSLFLVINSAVLRAQNIGTLKGIITDASDNSTIGGANVFDSSDKTHGTASDINGHYELRLTPGKHKMVCSFIGMKPDTFFVVIDSIKITEHNIILEPVATQLQTMVVSAGKYERKLEEITVSMEVLKPTLIENKNATNVKGVLEQAPGLNILDGEPQIRGGSGFNFGIGSRVAILIDGLPALAGDGGRPEWNFIPIENVAQIEIIKGASSVTYGSSALSGSINIRTAYPKDKPETKATLYSGLYDAPSVDNAKWWKGVANFSGGSVLHSQRFGQLDFVIGGMGIYDHGFIGPPSFRPGFVYFNDTTLTDDKVGEKTGRVNFNLRYRPKNIPRLNYGINGNFMRSSNSISLIWDNDTSGIYRAFPSTMTLQDQTILYVDPFINYFTTKDFKHSLRTRYFYTKNEVSSTPSNETQVAYSEYQLTKQVEKLGELNITGGIIMNQTYSHSDFSNDGILTDNRLQNFAVYTQVDKKMWDALNISLGFRDEYFKVNDEDAVVKPIFRSGLNLKVAQATFLRYSYGQGYRFPSLTEKYISSNIGGLNILPNPQLLPETSWNTEIGLKQGFKIKNFMGYIDAAIFWQQYANTIEFTYGAWDKKKDIYGDDSLVAGFKYINTGKTRVTGFEVSLTGQGNLSKNLKLDVLCGYTYVVPQALQPDFVFAKSYTLDTAMVPMSYYSSGIDSTNNILKYRFQHLPKVDIQLTYKRFSIGGSWRYYSFVQNIDKTFYLFEYLMKSGLKKYREDHDKGTHIIDARIGVDITKYLKLSFVANNVFNISYSLRPLKIESPRTFALRLALKI